MVRIRARVRNDCHGGTSRKRRLLAAGNGRHQREVETATVGGWRQFCAFAPSSGFLFCHERSVSDRASVFPARRPAANHHNAAPESAHDACPENPLRTARWRIRRACPGRPVLRSHGHLAGSCQHPRPAPCEPQRFARQASSSSCPAGSAAHPYINGGVRPPETARPPPALPRRRGRARRLDAVHGPRARRDCPSSPWSANN